MPLLAIGDNGDATGIQKTQWGKLEVESNTHIEIKVDCEEVDDLLSGIHPRERPYKFARDATMCIVGGEKFDLGEKPDLANYRDPVILPGDGDEKLKVELFTVTPQHGRIKAARPLKESTATAAPKRGKSPAPRGADRKQGGIVCYVCNKEGHKRNQCPALVTTNRANKKANAIQESLRETDAKSDAADVVISELREEIKELRSEKKDNSKEVVDRRVNNEANDHFAENMQGQIFVEPIKGFPVFGRCAYNFFGPIIWLGLGLTMCIVVTLPWIPLLEWIFVVYSSFCTFIFALLLDLFTKCLVVTKAISTRRKYTHRDPFRTNMDSHKLSPHEVFSRWDLIDPISTMIAIACHFPSDYVRALYEFTGPAGGVTFDTQVVAADTRPQSIRHNKITNDDPHIAKVKVEVMTDYSTISETELEVYATYISELLGSAAYFLEYEGEELNSRIAQAVAHSMNQVNYFSGENAMRYQPIFESTHILSCVIIQHLRAQLPRTNFSPTLVRVVNV